MPQASMRGQSGNSDAAKPVPFVPRNEREELALEVARTLREEHRLPIYLELCKTHSVEAIRRSLDEVKRVPESKIRKSKAALFTYLLKKHAQEQK
ncbi:MAG: hypothetical protein HZC01_03465 [Candidatus Kerfeldbacteria bacterium]|nr:hypothetical protein [Candidatus Kerfeldbacteria bacterium]